MLTRDSKVHRIGLVNVYVIDLIVLVISSNVKAKTDSSNGLIRLVRR
jgi:hypothetical protein